MRTADGRIRRLAWILIVAACAVPWAMNRALAGLVVEIQAPSTETFTTDTAEATALRAVAYLTGQESTTEVQAEISWTFGDGTSADGVPYTAHRWTTAGQFTVNVTATWQGVQANDQATAAVSSASGPTTTMIYGKAPLYHKILARRVDDGLCIWSAFTYTNHVIPGVPNEFDEGDSIYRFYYGDLPPGTYELTDYGNLAYCGRMSQACYVVTVIEGQTALEAGKVRRDISYDLFAPGDASNTTGTVYYGVPDDPWTPEDESANNTPAAGVLVQADGFSISGCQTTSAADGTFSLTNAIYHPYRITGQKSGYATAGPSYWTYESGALGSGTTDLFLSSTGTPSWGRIAGELPTPEMAGRYILLGGEFRLIVNTAAAYSVVCQAGEQHITLLGNWKVTSDPYGLASSPLSPHTVNVAAMQTASCGFGWGDQYGIVWGRVTDSAGAGRSNVIVRFWVGTLSQATEAYRYTDERGYFVIHLVPGPFSTRSEVLDPPTYSTTQTITVQSARTVRIDYTLD